jgi:hypothetical protein
MKIQLVPIDSVKPYELNSKKHPKEQIAKIASSIREFGWDQPIVVDKDFVIIKGHGRRLAAISLGMDKVPVLIRDDLTTDQVRAARLSDNRVAISDIDSELLQKELANLNFDMTLFFDEKELNFVGADLGMMNDDMFVGDLTGAVESQSKAVEEKMAATSGGRIPIAKALGFKDVPASAGVFIAKLMAYAEESTGQTGGDAFAQFAKEWDEQ